MSHDYKKYKLLRKFVNLFGFKLIEKNFIKNMIDIENVSIKVEMIVNKIVKENNFTKIIQIGSNDGITDDYVKKIIEKNNLKGVLVEPSLKPFLKLKENYNKIKNISLVNKALDKDIEPKNFYQIDEKYLSFYHENISVLSSFSKDHLLKWGIKSKHIVSTKVECINWKNLFQNFNFSDVQIICIDTEGHDHILISDLINETNVRPVIVFEWVNLPNNELNEILILLKKNNYELLKFQKDIICYQPNIKI